MDQVGVPLWAPQAHWQLHPSPGLNSGLVLIYLGVWETRRLRVGAEPAFPLPYFLASDASLHPLIPHLRAQATVLPWH